jgi:hypothetical protein
VEPARRDTGDLVEGGGHDRADPLDVEPSGAGFRVEISGGRRRYVKRQDGEGC